MPFEKEEFPEAMPIYPCPDLTWNWYVVGEYQSSGWSETQRLPLAVVCLDTESTLDDMSDGDWCCDRVWARQAGPYNGIYERVAGVHRHGQPYFLNEAKGFVLMQYHLRRAWGVFSPDVTGSDPFLRQQLDDGISTSCPTEATGWEVGDTERESTGETIWEKSKARFTCVRGSQAQATPSAAERFNIGQCLLHRRHNYRGAVVGFDRTCQQSEAWIRSMNVDSLKHGRNQPFYHVLPDTRDRPGAQLTYVAQENILPDTPPEPLQHPMVSEMFDEFDAANGRFVPNSQLRAQYPAEAQ